MTCFLTLNQNGRGVVLAYQVQPRREQQDYVHGFRALQEAGYTPQFLMADCETAIRNAAQTVWPEVQARACRFHVLQVTLKRTKVLILTCLCHCRQWRGGTSASMALLLIKSAGNVFISSYGP